MTGPGGSTTKRDQRREARREQYQQGQVQRQRQRTRQIRVKRIRQGSIIGGVIVLVALVALLLSVFVFHVGGGASSHTNWSQPVLTGVMNGAHVEFSDQGELSYVSHVATDSQRGRELALASATLSSQVQHVFQMRLYSSENMMFVDDTVDLNLLMTRI